MVGVGQPSGVEFGIGILLEPCLRSRAGGALREVKYSTVRKKQDHWHRSTVEFLRPHDL